ncbi:uncharacterized protein LOC110018444 isoform X2 [Phalaenopsis equestris]|uniref:uncharacterized protein LOC110018444 isoform X2 n=1 Tax=Phalaenopsis equestris TaxID=78828 RepID=UPI0009E2A904|nr:uncharacterized protein LOC110018444 isoform X2 [Phalaenopsis equestris]
MPRPDVIFSRYNNRSMILCLDDGLNDPPYEGPRDDAVWEVLCRVKASLSVAQRGNEATQKCTRASRSLSRSSRLHRLSIWQDLDRKERDRCRRRAFSEGFYLSSSCLERWSWMLASL